MFIVVLYICLYIFYFQDLDDFWDLLEKDVSRFGDGFQDFVDKFYVILVSVYMFFQDIQLNYDVLIFL